MFLAEITKLAGFIFKNFDKFFKLNKFVSDIFIYVIVVNLDKFN